MLKKILIAIALLWSVSLSADSAYQLGVKALQSKKYEMAMRYFYISARHHDARAYAELGNMYEHGLGTGINLQTAFYWYEKAAQKQIPKAQFHLAQLYEKGEGVKKNPQRARYWYQQAARRGYRQKGAPPSVKSAKTAEKKAETSQTVTQKEKNGFIDTLKFWK